MSKADITIPACLDAYEAFPSGVRDRRSLTFGLEFTTGSTIEIPPEIFEVTFGAGAISKCLIPLKSGESIAVLTYVDLPREIATSGKALVRGFLQESKFEDSQYLLKSRSGRVESDYASIERQGEK